MLPPPSSLTLNICFDTEGRAVSAPVLKTYAGEGEHGGLPAGKLALVLPGNDGNSGALQQDVIIPDSEESPERCLQQRQLPCLGMSPPSPHHTRGATDLATAAAAASNPDLGHSMDQAGDLDMHCSQNGLNTAAAAAAGSSLPGAVPDPAPRQDASHQQPEQASSGCSLEALPTHSPPKVCTQQGHGEHPLQQQQVDPQGEAEVHSRQSVVQPAGLVLQQSVGQSRLGQEAPPDNFGSPVAPAPAGPVEYLGDEPVMQAGVQGQDGDVNVSDGVQPGSLLMVRCDMEHRGRLLEGSQPSSSSLKRVPETPDSTENRSPPTQSPCGESCDIFLHCMSDLKHGLQILHHSSKPCSLAASDGCHALLP